ncbi:universal stress protein [Nonomuraea sediminis]|uniref:universal stress protein n=1 Tax=Nonomuraea sediminis TaxID=2835864 RepID=UPI001BDDA122|nr:universal stress protein [Nonomuraea sediminis]
MDQELPYGPRVVVGLDDSPASRWALAWAIGEARLRRMPLLAVHVSRAPVCTVPEALPLDYPARLEEAAKSRDLIDSLFVDVAGGIPGDVHVVRMGLLGEPWQHLVELARPGDLLVLGRGARRGWIRLVLTSTRRRCARHANATMIIVSSPRAPDQPEPSARRTRRLRHE